MIGPVSGTGRAMMASLQQAIQKGMPPDQAIQYVKSMATQGVAPLTDLYAMMNQFQRLKQQQVKPPQTPPTIRDELNVMSNQQRMAQMQPQAAPPMAQGLGGMDAGSMENPQFNAAGGGIVAFDDGGFITKPKDNPDNPLGDYRPDPEVQRQIQEFGDYDYSRGPMGAPYSPRSDAQRIGGGIVNALRDPAVYGAIAGGVMGGPLGAIAGGNAAGYINRLFTGEPNPVTSRVDALQNAYQNYKDSRTPATTPPGMAQGGVVKMAAGTPKSGFQAVGAPISMFEDVTEGSLLTPDEEKEFSSLLQLQRNVSMSPYVDPAAKSLWNRSKPRYQELLLKRKGAQEKEITARQEAATKAEAESRGLKYVPQDDNAPPAAAPAAGTAGTTGTRAPAAPAAPSYGNFGDYRKEVKPIIQGLTTEANLTPMQRYQQSEADLKALGIGKSLEERGKYLTQREIEADKELGQDKRMALAQAGFAMAEAASRRGRERTGFLGAAAAGGTRGTQLYQAALKENRALKNSIADSRFALDQAQEQMKVGNYREGAAQAREAKQNLRSAQLALATNELKISEFTATQAGLDRRLATQLKAYADRYRMANNAQRMKLMANLLPMAPGLIKGYKDMSSEEQQLALHKLLTGLSGDASLSGSIELDEGEED